MNMSFDGLVQTIGQQGDMLWNDKLATLNRHGRGFPLNKSEKGIWLTYWLFKSFLPHYPRWRIVLVVFVAPIIICEPVILLLRLPTYLFVSLLWRLRRSFAHKAGRSFLCPLCYNPMKDPYYYCPRCKEIQPLLEPRINCLFFRTCSCGKSIWSIWGQYSGRKYKNLVCRNTERYFGCYRPYRLHKLAGCSSKYYVLTGTSVRAKHAVMAHLFQYLTVVGLENEGILAPAWPITQTELELCRRYLCEVLSHQSHDASAKYPLAKEKLGKKYSLAQSFALASSGGQTAHVFHNLPNRLFAQTKEITKFDLEWNSIRCLIIVIDVKRRSRLPWSEQYSRLVRVIEEYLELEIGKHLPIKIAIVVPYQGSAAPRASLHSTSDQVRDEIMKTDPTLGALLQRTTAEKDVRFFGGPIPEKFDLQQTAWLGELAEWIIR